MIPYNPSHPASPPGWTPDGGWNPVDAGGVPLGTTLETYRAGESGTAKSICLMRHTGEEPEWVDAETGATTVTHSTYVPPTHWRWPQPHRFCDGCEREYGEPHRNDCTRITETFVGRPLCNSRIPF